MTAMEKIGRVLRKIREERDKTQAEVAHAAGISRPHYSLIESGNGNLKINTLESIASVLKISVCDIVCRKAPKKRTKKHRRR